jgi:hypothetical protein
VVTITVARARLNLRRAQRNPHHAKRVTLSEKQNLLLRVESLIPDQKSKSTLALPEIVKQKRLGIIVMKRV